MRAPSQGSPRPHPNAAVRLDEEPEDTRFVRWAPANPAAFALLRAELTHRQVGQLTGECWIGGIPEWMPDIRISWFGPKRSTTFSIATEPEVGPCTDERPSWVFLAIDNYLYDRLEGPQARRWPVP